MNLLRMFFTTMVVTISPVATPFLTTALRNVPDLGAPRHPCSLDLTHVRINNLHFGSQSASRLLYQFSPLTISLMKIISAFYSPQIAIDHNPPPPLPPPPYHHHHRDFITKLSPLQLPSLPPNHRLLQPPNFACSSGQVGQVQCKIHFIMPSFTNFKSNIPDFNTSNRTFSIKSMPKELKACKINTPPPQSVRLSQIVRTYPTFFSQRNPPLVTARIATKLCTSMITHRRLAPLRPFSRSQTPSVQAQAKCTPRLLTTSSKSRISSIISSNAGRLYN